MSSQDYNKLTVSQLRAELTERGLDDKGKKMELVDRLKENDQGEEEKDAAAEDTGKNGEEVMDESMENKEGNEEEEEDEDEPAEYVMLDEADVEEELEGEDGDEEEVDEEELLGGEELQDLEDGEEKADEEEEEGEVEEEEESEEKKNKEEEGEDDGKSTKSAKSTKSTKSTKKDGADGDKKKDEKKEKRKETKLTTVEGGFTEEEMKTMEEEYKKREGIEKDRESRVHDLRYIYRIYKHTCLKFIEDSLNNKSVVIKKFKPEFLSNEAVQEGIQVADQVNVHTDANAAGGFCEFVIRNNKLNQEIRKKVTEALPECEVTSASRSFLQEMVDKTEKRFKKNPDFQDKYRECILLACLEVTGDEKLEAMSPLEIEDEVAPYFPDAYNITVPDSLEDCKRFRFVLVEFTSTKVADEKLNKIREDKDTEMTVAGKKLNFSIYQRKWLDEKFKMRREGNEKVDPIREFVRTNDDSSKIMTAEERQACRMRIEQVYKSLKPYHKEDAYYKILSDEKTLMREKLRMDDRKRDKLKLPILQWNADKMVEEEKVEKKKEEKKEEKKDSKEKDTKDAKKTDDRKKNPRNNQGANKRGRSPSKDAGRNQNNKRPDRRRSPNSPRRRGTGRWQDNRVGVNSIMGTPPQMQMGGGGRGNRGNRGMGGGGGGGNMRNNNNQMNQRGMQHQQQHMGGGMNQMNMMNNQAMMQGGMGGMMPQQHMMQQQQGMNPVMMGGMGQQQPVMGQPDTGASNNPVQLLLGLSKVLSNQIKQMQTSDGTPIAGGASVPVSTARDYRDRAPIAPQDSYYRGAAAEPRGRGAAYPPASNARSPSAGGYERPPQYY